MFFEIKEKKNFFKLYEQSFEFFLDFLYRFQWQFYNF